MKDEIIKVLEEISTLLQRDGGDVKFVDVNDQGVVTVKLMGACGNCPSALVTLKSIVEGRLKAEVPGVAEVVGI